MLPYIVTLIFFTDDSTRLEALNAKPKYIPGLNYADEKMAPQLLQTDESIPSADDAVGSPPSPGTFPPTPDTFPTSFGTFPPSPQHYFGNHYSSQTVQNR